MADTLKERVNRYLANATNSLAKRLVQDLMDEIEVREQRIRHLETVNSEIAEAHQRTADALIAWNQDQARPIR